MTEIVKVQVPILGHGRGDGDALIYAQGRSRMKVAPVTGDMRRGLRGSLKAFFYAEHTDGQWLVDYREQAPWQS